jgi:cytochrome P450/NADPH-cytochrome P450 reductase
MSAALPDGVAYEAGDHLGVVSHNADELVERVTRRFGLDPDAHIRLHCDTGTTDTFLPLGARIPIRLLLSGLAVSSSGVGSRRLGR